MLKSIKKALRPAVNRVREEKISADAKKAEKHYVSVIENIKKSGRHRLNFAAYVIYDSTFGMDGVFKLMLNEPEKWNPKIVVIPDICRGREHALKTYAKTKDFFVSRYGKEYVIDGWNPDKDEFYDHLDKFDIVYYANPYDHLVHRYHRIVYASTKNVLPVHVPYGFEIGKYTTLSRIKSRELNVIWKVFADTTYSYNDYVKNQPVKGRNVTLAGYSKMDALKDFPAIHNTRKKILITPHHTVSFDTLPLSNFLQYSELIRKLPDIFPDVDFVFRPHPFLFNTLVSNGYWTSAQVDEYLKDLQSKGVEYSTGGDYLKIFSECDAIVNDCGSFTVEWLFTGKPGCFVYNKALKPDHLSDLMNKAVEDYTVARSEEDIISFIRNIAEDKETRDYRMKDWVKENIAINYPNVSEYIFKELDILA